MRRFTTLCAIAAPLPLANVDTDRILAGQYLKTISRDGLGPKLFSTMRYDIQGDERPDFILNRPPWRTAGILVTLENFGSGSSREHAVWALADFGISCIIAPSFADIFYNNCQKNGLLPIVLARGVVDQLMMRASDPDSATFSIDLAAQTIQCNDGTIIEFPITAERKDSLLQGRDEITATLEKLAEIERWESTTQLISPPIPLDVGALTMGLDGRAARQ